MAHIQLARKLLEFWHRLQQYLTHTADRGSVYRNKESAMKRTTLCTALVAGALYAAIASPCWAQQCGDVDDSGTIAASDALLVLRRAVGQPVSLVCAAGAVSTGQMTCYDAVGTVIDCTDTGQDGEVQAGQPRTFTNNGDGTITDDGSGLMWEAKCDGPNCDPLHDKDTSYTWDEAFTLHVATLNSESFAGYTDWRVPNITELHSLVNYEMVSPSAYDAFNTCATNCDVTSCSCTVSSDYWSSTSLSSFPNNAWVVNLSNGAMFFGAKSTVRFVRAVRGGL